MSTTNPPSDLHLAMQTWHAALARNDLNAQIAARLLVDILVAGGLDERIEEITRPAHSETGPVLPLLRRANRLTRDLGHLAACQLATARQLDRSLTRRTASPTQPSRAARHPRLQAIVRLDLASLLLLLAMATYAGFLIGASIAYRPTPSLFPFEIPPPPRLAPAPATPPANRITAVLTPSAPPPAEADPS